MFVPLCLMFVVCPMLCNAWTLVVLFAVYNIKNIMHRYSPDGATVNITSISLKPKQPDIRQLTFYYFTA